MLNKEALHIIETSFKSEEREEATHLGSSVNEETIISAWIVLGPLKLYVIEVGQLIIASLLQSILWHSKR